MMLLLLLEILVPTCLAFYVYVFPLYDESIWNQKSVVWFFFFGPLFLSENQE